MSEITTSAEGKTFVAPKSGAENGSFPTSLVHPGPQEMDRRVAELYESRWGARPKNGELQPGKPTIIGSGQARR